MARQLSLETYGVVKTEDGKYESKKMSKNLKAEDIGKPGSEADAIVQEVREYTFKPEEGPKVILTLSVPDVNETESVSLALNKTNLLAMLHDFGEDMDKWVGAAITLKIERTTYEGKQKSGIRVYRA